MFGFTFNKQELKQDLSKIGDAVQKEGIIIKSSFKAYQELRRMAKQVK